VPLIRATAAAIFLMSSLNLVRAQSSTFQPQVLTVQRNIAPGPNVFTIDQEWKGASAINVFDAVNLSFKGSVSTGSMAQMLISKDGRRAFTASVYMRRIVSGDAEMVLQEFDVSTLSQVKEIALPPKFAMLSPYRNMLAQSADGRFVYVQNATPASSVAVVDVVKGVVTGEVPTPGCFGIYASLEGWKFSTLCGDGSIATFVIEADGAGSRRMQSQRIFDPDRDPLFMTSIRCGEELVFISYAGVVYRISDRSETAQLVGQSSIVSKTKGAWAPGGFQLIGYNAPNDVLFVSMHADAHDGTHKQGSREIWAYLLGQGRLVHRIPITEVRAFAVSDDKTPVLYAIRGQELFRFAGSATSKYSLKRSHSTTSGGTFNLQVEVRQ